MMSAELKGSYGNVTLNLQLTKIGRAQGNQLILNDTEVSWQHAQILQQGQRHSLVDLGSRNGTFVNEQRLAPNSPLTLHAGDILRFGNTSFTYANEAIKYTPTKAAPPSFAPPPPATPTPPYIFQQQASFTSPPTTPTKKEAADGGTPRWIIIVGGLASLATIFGVIFGIYTYAHPAPSAPSAPAATTSTLATTATAPAIPRLHGSYIGDFSSSAGGNPIQFAMSSLTEDDNGNFSASGGDGLCSATYKGVMHSNNSILFTLTQAANPSLNCLQASITFRGTLFTDQHLEGTWQGNDAFAQTNGSWSMQ